MVCHVTMRVNDDYTTILVGMDTAEKGDAETDPHQLPLMVSQLSYMEDRIAIPTSIASGADVEPQAMAVMQPASHNV